MLNSPDRKTFSSVSGFGITVYDPIRQVLLELSDLSEEPTESRREATSLHSVMTSSKFYFKHSVMTSSTLL